MVVSVRPENDYEPNGARFTRRRNIYRIYIYVYMCVIIWPKRGGYAVLEPPLPNVQHHRHRIGKMFVCAAKLQCNATTTTTITTRDHKGRPKPVLLLRMDFRQVPTKSRLRTEFSKNHARSYIDIECVEICVCVFSPFERDATNRCVDDDEDPLPNRPRRSTGRAKKAVEIVDNKSC